MEYDEFSRNATVNLSAVMNYFTPVLIAIGGVNRKARVYQTTDEAWI